MAIWHQKNREKIHSKLKTTVLLYHCLSTGKYYQKLFCRESDGYWIRKSLRPSMLTWRGNWQEMWYWVIKMYYPERKRKQWWNRALELIYQSHSTQLTGVKFWENSKKKRNWAKNISPIKCLLNVTNLQIKRGKQKKGIFRTTWGVLQCGTFSPSLFTL